MSSVDEFDFVVVGGGSAGCVVAGRLSESGAHQVALLEAGGPDNSFWIHAPLGFGKLYSEGKLSWIYQCEPEQELAGTGSIALRGKVLGGTGSINGLVYLRGQREDYDYWRQLGNVGWAYEDVLPYFRKSEDNDRGADAYHGTGGPLGIASLPHHELVDAFVEAGIQAGYPANSDFNGATQEGFGFTQMTARNGRRCSTADAFIHSARRRSNLKTILNSQATRVLIENGKAVGVEYRRGGQINRVMARREVILSAGTFNSPHLLQLSGVGPASLLKEYGIPIVVDLPGVGENLHDHFTAPMSYHCTKKITINDIVGSPIRRVLMGIQYVLFRKGLMATNANFGGGFIRTDPALAVPDIRLHISLWSLSVLGRPKERMGLSPFSSFSVSIHLLSPESRGTVRLKSRDPMEHPAIHYNLFRSERDHNRMVEAVRVVRNIMTKPAIAPYVAEEVSPGPESTSYGDIVRFFRDRGRPNNHSSSTCKMGVDDKAVVDPRLRVRGVAGLRVADASIMPRVVAANTNAATIMIGEKGAAMVLEDAK